MMEQNHPTFLIAFLAISKIGAIPALINYNLTGEPLLHCVTITGSKTLLFDPSFSSHLASVADKMLDAGIRLAAFGEATEFDESECAIAPSLIPSVLAQYSSDDTDESLLKGITEKDAAILIYTSGTTGLPKAAIVQHMRLNGIVWGSVYLSRLTANDVSYNCLPLYHGTGLYMALSKILHVGGTFVLARKFSVSRFWDDVYNNNVTVCYYIGELARYLMNAPSHPLERKHRVRLFFGNGMPADIWSAFRERFNINEINEFYGATESPTGVFNVNKNEFSCGAVASYGILLRTLRTDIRIIKVDPLTEEPIRNKDGRCIECGYGEPGEMLIDINGQGGRAGFEGYYKNKAATSKKLIRGAFKKDDVYFRSGDLLKMTNDGLLFFVDRLGDTFRWRGENVSTTEVQQVVCRYPAIAEANVFGVLVPQHSGRAGMVALILREGTQLDFTDFYNHLAKHLPKYAIPVFLRFVPSMTMTGNFKQQKVALRDEGIDKIPENQPVFWLRNGTYVPFTKNDHAQIASGSAKI
ncbi:hypothetical protein BX666DRAFT_1998515 [Dichotomocladium elegans]|nr:hypothetical protein BX666DRAFT_1998515 [Dichotomocladium elegans]